MIYKKRLKKDSSEKFESGLSRNRNGLKTQ